MGKEIPQVIRRGSRKERTIRGAECRTRDNQNCHFRNLEAANKGRLFEKRKGGESGQKWGDRYGGNGEGEGSVSGCSSKLSGAINSTLGRERDTR